MSNFFAPDPTITDPALRNLEKKVHWLMYQIYLSNLAASLDNAGVDSSSINVNNFPSNFDPAQLTLDFNDVQNNNE